MSASQVWNQYVAAATEYIARKQGYSKPTGRCDNGGRWYPSGIDEVVTRTVRSPSRAWPWSYYKACFTLKHIARAFGVDESSLRGMVKRMEKLA